MNKDKCLMEKVRLIKLIVSVLYIKEIDVVSIYVYGGENGKEKNIY